MKAWKFVLLLSFVPMLAHASTAWKYRCYVSDVVDYPKWTFVGKVDSKEVPADALTCVGWSNNSYFCDDVQDKDGNSIGRGEACIGLTGTEAYTRD